MEHPKKSWFSVVYVIVDGWYEKSYLVLYLDADWLEIRLDWLLQWLCDVIVLQSKKNQTFSYRYKDENDQLFCQFVGQFSIWCVQSLRWVMEGHWNAFWNGEFHALHNPLPQICVSSPLGYTSAIIKRSNAPRRFALIKIIPANVQ